MANDIVLRQPLWRIIEHSQFAPRDNALASFAVDDILCQTVGYSESAATARSWIHDRTVVLGIQDGRLPYLQAGIAFLKTNGWHVIMRNSGGLAVVLDEGIFNLSLILNEKQNKLSIEKGYETMVHLLRQMLQPYGIEFVTGEIAGSYCSGSYDLSVNGRKFAGISQRRIRGGASVQVYVCMNGSGAKRAELLKSFYEIASNGEFAHCPVIRPETMASLTELSSHTIKESDLSERLTHCLATYGKTVMTDLTIDETQLFDHYYKNVQARNEKTLF